MSLSQEILWALTGAWQLARTNTNALSWFNLSLTGYRRSFMAALFTLPLWAVLVGIYYMTVPSQLGFVRVGAVELAAYGLSWMVMPLLAIPLCKSLGLGQHYVGYIVALNWSKFLVTVASLPVYLVIYLATGWSGLGLVVFFVFMAGVFFYRWYVARIALGASWTVATLFVVVELTALAGIAWLTAALL
jgi:hypothetical protein